MMQRAIAAQSKPIQEPFKFRLNLNARVHPKGIEISQYAMKFANRTKPVFFNPLKIPDSDTCNPSKT